MAKKTITLTESELHRVIKESVERILESKENLNEFLDMFQRKTEDPRNAINNFSKLHNIVVYDPKQRGYYFVDQYGNKKFTFIKYEKNEVSEDGLVSKKLLAQKRDQLSKYLAQNSYENNKNAAIRAGVEQGLPYGQYGSIPKR